MKLLLQKLLANVGESYSPQKVKQLLDQHQESIVDILFYFPFFCFICAVYVIFIEIRRWKFKRPMK